MIPQSESCPQLLGPLTAALAAVGGELCLEGEPGSRAQNFVHPTPPSWQVNDMPFRNLTREEAVQVLLGLPLGEEVELVTQRKQDSECGGSGAVCGPVVRPTPSSLMEPPPVYSLPENGAVLHG